MTHIKGRELRQKRIRKKLLGTAERPRLVIYRSLKNLYAQLRDDVNNKTIASYSTNTPVLKERIKYGGGVKAASLLGEFLAKKTLEKGIKSLVFDRSGYKYHGRVKMLAEAAIKGGLSFGRARDSMGRKDNLHKQGSKGR